jgi:hypothetical protein
MSDEHVYRYDILFRSSIYEHKFIWYAREFEEYSLRFRSFKQSKPEHIYWKPKRRSFYHPWPDALSHGARYFVRFVLKGEIPRDAERDIYRAKDELIEQRLCNVLIAELRIEIRKILHLWKRAEKCIRRSSQGSPAIIFYSHGSLNGDIHAGCDSCRCQCVTHY